MRSKSPYGTASESSSEQEAVVLAFSEMTLVCWDVDKAYSKP